MDKIKYIIYGASGHAKVVIETIRSKKEQGTIQVYDDDPSKKKCLDIAVLHEFDTLDHSAKFIFGIGNNSLRKSILEKINLDVGFAPAIIHQSAVVSKTSIIDKGSVVFANASINTEAKIGKHCIINTGAVVEHDCRIGDFVHISPNATLSGNVSVGEGSHIGSGAVIIPGIKIGKHSTIGAGAVIIKDIPDHAVVVGNPGKIIRCGKHP